MKRILATMLTLTLALALLAGCGSKTNDAANDPQPGNQEEQTNIPTYTPTEIRASNSARNLLTHHNTVAYTPTFTDRVKSGNWSAAAWRKP